MSAKSTRPPRRPVVSRGVALLLLASLLGSARSEDTDRAAGPTSRFDGVWQTILSCPDSHGALGYSFQFPSTVRHGQLHGEKGTRGEPGWLQIDGPIGPDGKASLYADGLIGAADFAVGRRPAGTQYGYHIDARFAADRGEGQRIEGRHCSLMWTRRP